MHSFQTDCMRFPIARSMALCASPSNSEPIEASSTKS